MTPRPLTAAIYVRVSTQDQKYDMQLTELRGYVERMGWASIEYAEKQSSVKHRPVLEQLMKDAQLRKFDVVLVWKIDRFARSMKQFTGNILALDQAGVRFIAPNQGIDTDKQNPMGKFLMHIMAAFAELERGMIVDRVNAGLAEARRQGRVGGRRKRVFRRDEAFRLRESGMSFRKIAAQMGVPLATVADAVKAFGKPFSTPTQK
jgi:DNA invertase Pin-like site-specific DNA recombinase